MLPRHRLAVTRTPSRVARVAWSGLLAASLACGDGGPVHVEAPVGSVAFTITEDTITAGTARTFAVNVQTADGQPMPDAAVVWGSTDAAIATVDGRGRVSAARGGAARIVASVRGVSDTLTLTVHRATVFQLSVSGIAEPLAEGDSARLTITLRAPNGAVIDDGRAVQYRSSAPAVAVVDASGVVRALTPGHVTITATSDDRTGTLELDVVRASVASVDLRAGAALLIPGRALQLSANPIDRHGRTLTGRAITYSSSNSTVASVSATGFVTGHAIGSVSVTATAEGTRATIAVQVVVPPASAYSIDTRFIGPVAPDAADAVRAAVARWSRVITGDLPDAQITLPANGCFAGTPAVHERVDDLLLLVMVDSVDGAGGVLGHAGPCVVRTNGLPIVGVIQLDRDDLAWVMRDGLAVDLIAHEIGHVLGIGPFWDGSSSVVGLRSASPGFVGARAREAQAAVGYAATAAMPVPIENEGGPGTRDAHWRDRTFGDELMTGWLNARGNPLSLITVNALADLGYAVTPTGAEPFAFSFERQAPSAQLSRPERRVAEREILPRWLVDADGRLTRAR